MFWNKKPKKENKEVKELLVRKNKIVSDGIQKFEVGKTQVMYTFMSGEEFMTLVYGEVRQYKHLGNDETNYHPVLEPCVDDVNVYQSLKKAEDYISSLNTSTQTYVDDPMKPRKSVSGIVVKAEIHDTMSHEVEFTVSKVVPKQEGGL